jgi:hypothetical protein
MPNRRQPRLRRRYALAALMLALLGFLATGAVQEAPTPEDREALLRFGIIGGPDLGVAPLLDADDQRRLLTRIVQRVHASVDRLDPLPNDHAREPIDVLNAGTGVCMDRARVIEKAARLAGFEARRVFLVYGGWSKLLLPGGPTHTLVEVRVRQGWVFLGTLTPVTGFSGDGRVWAVKDLRADVIKGGRTLRQNAWAEVIATDFLPVYGLYSRHGGHYPPYTPVPDYSLRQMWQAGLGLRID